MTSTASLLSFARMAALAPALSLSAPADAAAQGAGAVYQRRDACVEAGRLSETQCEFAYRNARAEFDQKVPRYGSRAQCEQRHGRCGAQLSSTSGSGWDALAKGRAVYAPRFSGIRVSGEGAAMRVLPVVEGTGRIAFAPRIVTAPADAVSGRLATIEEARYRGSRRNAPKAAGPYVKRGDRDDTVPVPMEKKSIGSDVAPGLYVDPDGVEWYKPAHKR